jgi:hypothetical protein
MLAAPTFPWGIGSWAPLLRPEVDAELRLDERSAEHYGEPGHQRVPDAAVEARR